jgi:hypothetical protein
VVHPVSQTRFMTLSHGSWNYCGTNPSTKM